MRNLILSQNLQLESGIIVPEGSIVTILPMTYYNDADSLYIYENLSFQQIDQLLCEYFEIIYSPSSGFTSDLSDVLYIDHIHFSELPEYLLQNHIEVQT